MTLDDYFRDQISRGQPPMVALHNAAQTYAGKIKLEYRRPDCSQYANETQAWGEQRDREAVELLREAIQILDAPSLWNQLARASRWSTRVRKFLEGKQ